MLYKSVSIVHRNQQSHMRTRANHCTAQAHPPTLRDKRIYTCSGTSWTGILLAVRSRSVLCI